MSTRPSAFRNRLALYDFEEEKAGSYSFDRKYYFDTLAKLKEAACTDGYGAENKTLNCNLDRTPNLNIAILDREYRVADDSVALGKMIYKLEKTEKGWTVIGTTHYHKCHEGRGNSFVWNNMTCN